MAKNIKTFIIMLSCLAIVISCLAGCSPEGSSEINQDSSPRAKDADEVNDEVNQKINELVDKMLSPPVILSHESGEIIYGSGDRELIFIKGYTDKGCSVEVYANGEQVQGNVAVDGNGNFETLNGVEISEGENNIKLISVNTAGRKSTATAFNLFLVVPQKVEYSVYDNATSLKEIKDNYYTEEINPMVYIYGSHLPSSKVFVQVNNKIAGEIECDSSGMFRLEDVMLQQGSNEIAIWVRSGDGFISAPVFKNIIVHRDLYDPIPSDLTGYKQGNANYLSWSTSTDSDFYSYKLVKVEDPCINPEYPENNVIATFSNINAKSYTDNDIVSGKAYFYTLWTLDKAGRAVSSNVVAIPKPVYSLTFTKVPSSISNTIARREWFYQAYEMTNMGNVTVDVQPIMLWLKLEPNPDEEMEISPLWEVHIWNPSNGIYYYSNEDIYSTYISDWRNFDGYTEVEETETLSEDGLTKTITVTETTKKTEDSDVNLKRRMTETIHTTKTEIDLTTGISTTGPTTTNVSTAIVEPEKIGSPITGLEPGEKIIIEVKVQNIAAENGEKIIVHFHFYPIDCDGHFYIDEHVSTLDIPVIGESRN
jgi:hypothetical protein